jgi:membrane dipeptidase
VEPDLVSRGEICLVAAAPSVTPWSLRRERAALAEGGVDAVHIAGLVGAGHVGLGLDFADEGEEEYDFYGYDERYYPRPPWVWPRGIEWLHQCGGISQALQARGFSPHEAAGVMGTNFLRVLATIWGS